MKVQSKKDFPYVVQTNNNGEKVRIVGEFICPSSGIDSQWEYFVCYEMNEYDIEDNLNRVLKTVPLISFDEWQSLPDFPKPEYDPKDVAFNQRTVIGYKLIKPEYKEAVKSICKCKTDFDPKCFIGLVFQVNSDYYNKLKDAEVLHWFEPVYEKETITLKSGVKLSEDDIAEVKEILNNK